jgi:hypothetical protein
MGRLAALILIIGGRIRFMRCDLPVTAITVPSLTNFQIEPVDLQIDLDFYTFIVSVVNMVDSDGNSVGLYPLPPELIPTPPLKIDGSNNDLGFSAHNVTHITALNCTLDIDETEMVIDIETKALISPSLSEAANPLTLDPDTNWTVADFLISSVGVSQIFTEWC